MPKVSKLKLAPLNLGEETLGQRIARLRKGKGYTQIDLAGKIGILQGIISEYETDKLRPHYEMIIRLAMALEVSTDELLGMKVLTKNEKKPDTTLIRRLRKIETLPSSQRKVVIKTIDTVLSALKK